MHVYRCQGVQRSCKLCILYPNSSPVRINRGRGLKPEYNDRHRNFAERDRSLETTSSQSQRQVESKQTSSSHPTHEHPAEPRWNWPVLSWHQSNHRVRPGLFYHVLLKLKVEVMLLFLQQENVIIGNWNLEMETKSWSHLYPGSYLGWKRKMRGVSLSVENLARVQLHQAQQYRHQKVKGDRV